MTEKQICHVIIERANLTSQSTVREIVAAVHEARAGSWSGDYERHIVTKIVKHLI